MIQASPRILTGIGVSPGIAIGQVFLFDRNAVRVPRFHIEQKDVPQETIRLSNAVAAAVSQLQMIRSRFIDAGMDHQSILEAHELMLKDPTFFSETETIIGTQLINAEWAVSQVISRLRSLFNQMADQYLRERSSDINFIGERILKTLTGQHTDVADFDIEFTALRQRPVIVAHDLSPVDTVVFARQKITAFVTEIGGKTSHTSILARSLEVPAVVGATGIFNIAANYDTIVVDGLDGTVMLRPSSQQLEQSRQRSERFRQIHLELLQARTLPNQTLDGIAIGITGNIEHVDEVHTVLSRGGDGIGLYRTEYMFLSNENWPNEETHYQTYLHLAQALGNRLCTVRTLDLGSDKALAYSINENEANPALGLRGIRMSLHNMKVFDEQISGILRAALHGNIRIMLPMISGLSELQLAKVRIQQVSTRLTQQGVAHQQNVPIGIMIEIPSAAVIADILASQCDFIAIGTNDLLQYLLAIDRTNERVNYLYNPLHPAVLRTLSTIVRSAQRNECPVSICGEMAGDIEMIPILLGLGLNHYSMNSGSIPAVKRLVREIYHQDCIKLVEEAMHCHTPEDVALVLQTFTSTKQTNINTIYRL